MITYVLFFSARSEGTRTAGNSNAKSSSKINRGSLKKEERRHLTIVKDIPLPPKDTRRTKNVYNSLSEMEMKIGKQKLSGYQLESQEKKIILKKMKLPYTLPYVEITVDESLEFTCSILGWIVPDIHTVYRTFRRSARRRTIAELIDFVNNFMHWNVNTVVSY